MFCLFLNTLTGGDVRGHMYRAATEASGCSLKQQVATQTYHLLPPGTADKWRLCAVFC
jgi:hypothetical protein